MKKILILGSNKYFENIVTTAKNNIYTIVCDVRKDTFMKKICDENIDIGVK